MEKQIINRGAEAILYLDELDGQTVLVKERVKKGYRIPQIDKKLRKERTTHESKLLSDARSVGVNTPQVLEISEYRITMEFIKGKSVKELFSNSKNCEIEDVCRSIGESLGKLHAANIIHGDMTTSNIIKSDDGRIYFIDFGLGFYSKRLEDKGVDIRVLRDAIKAAHYNILKLCWLNILIGYRKEYKDAEKVINKIDEIEGRTRYAKRVPKAKEPER